VETGLSENIQVIIRRVIIATEPNELAANRVDNAENRTSYADAKRKRECGG
jgi:hypothetical protein